MACRGSFLSCPRENHPDPKPSREVDPVLHPVEDLKLT